MSFSPARGGIQLRQRPVRRGGTIRTRGKIPAPFGGLPGQNWRARA
jgi:hypothetical protein